MTGTLAGALMSTSASAALSIVVKVTIVLSIALLAVRLCRKGRASLRHAILASAFCVTVVLPAATLLLPAFDIRLAPPDAAAWPSLAGGTSDGASSGSPQGAAPSAAPRTGRLPALVSVSIGIWTLGTVAFLVPIGIGILRRRQLRRGGLPWLEGRELVSQLASERGIRREVELLRHEDLSSPMTCGVLRPAILLPADASDWHDDATRRALIHELEHIKRADAAFQLLAELACALYWFHPLVWIAARRLHLDAELACDDAVVSIADRTEYATQLVRLAQRLSPNVKLSGLAMVTRSDLSTRVSAILNSHQPRGPLGHVTAIGIACLAAIVGVGGASVRAVQAPGQTPAASLSFEVASLKLNVSGPGPFAILPLPGRLRGTNIPAKFLVAAAFAPPGQGPLLPYQIVGGPDWLNAARFDLEAKAPESVGSAYTGPPVALFGMLKTLLLERFKMTVRADKRELPVYTLVRARGDEQLGPQLVRRSEAECAALAAQPKSSGGPTTASGRPAVGFRSGIDSILGGCARLALLINQISRLHDRVVVDGTGLEGLFDYELVWTPDTFQLSQLNQGGARGGALPSPTDGASQLTALTEQLGLRLESSRATIDVIVIDRAEMPQSN
jgi:uncharacterized protein (TIGR03435 family)